MTAAPRQTTGDNVARRVGFAAVAIPLAFGVVWYGGLPLAIVVAAVAVLGARELFDLAGRSGIRPSRVFGLGAAAVIPLVTYAALSDARAAEAVNAAWPYATALWTVALLTWALATRAPDERPLAAVAVTLLAIAYTSALPSFLLAIRHGRHPTQSWAGTWLVFFPLIVTWVCDTAAMFGGKAVGGPKLAPRISPGKTRSGTLCGIAGGMAVAPLFAAAVFPEVGVHGSLLALVAIAAVLTVVGQVGDLAESLFKREVGVKDSSHLIPGHGGVLDRFDSLYFVLPVSAALYRLLGVA